MERPGSPASSGGGFIAAVHGGVECWYIVRKTGSNLLAWPEPIAGGRHRVYFPSLKRKNRRQC